VKFREMKAGREADVQAVVPRSRQIYSQAGRHTGRHADRQVAPQTDRQAQGKS
jgi:hypothetical protein